MSLYSELSVPAQQQDEENMQENTKKVSKNGRPGVHQHHNQRSRRPMFLQPNRCPVWGWLVDEESKPLPQLLLHLLSPRPPWRSPSGSSPPSLPTSWSPSPPAPSPSWLHSPATSFTIKRFLATGLIGQSRWRLWQNSVRERFLQGLKEFGRVESFCKGWKFLNAAIPCTRPNSRDTMVQPRWRRWHPVLLSRERVLVNTWTKKWRWRKCFKYHQRNAHIKALLNIHICVLYKGTHRRRTFLEEFLLCGLPLLEDLPKCLLVKENVFIRLLGVWPANKEWVTKFAAGPADLHKRCRTLSRSRDFSFCSKVFAPNISTHDLYLRDTTDTKNHCLRNFRQQKYTHDLPDGYNEHYRETDTSVFIRLRPWSRPRYESDLWVWMYVPLRPVQRRKYLASKNHINSLHNIDAFIGKFTILVSLCYSSFVSS